MTEDTHNPLNLPMPSSRKIKDIPSSDRKERFGKINIVRYSPELALQICERIAKGERLKEICHERGMPTRATFWKWVMLYEGLDKAYNAAREMSAQSMEEDALALADQLAAPHKLSSTRVQGIKIAMDQYRWSAARRDPARFGTQAEARIVVPVQINTTLDVKASQGSEGGLYSITAKAPDPEAEDDPQNVPYAVPEEPDRRMIKRPVRRRKREAKGGEERTTDVGGNSGGE